MTATGVRRGVVIVPGGLPTRYGVAHVAQEPLVLALLPVSLLLRLLGLGLLLAGPLLLGCVFLGSALSLLGSALGLFLLVAGKGARGFLHPSLELVLHRSFFALAPLVGSASWVSFLHLYRPWRGTSCYAWSYRPIWPVRPGA